MQHNFFLINKNTNLHLQHVFLSFFAVVLHNYNTVCTTKTSSFLVTHYFYGGVVVCAYQRFLFPVFMLAFIFSLPLIFT